MARSDSELLQYALIGLRSHLADIDGKIAEIRSQLGGRGVTPVSTDGSSAPRAKRNMSAAATARIAAAQRKRWAAYHKEHGTTGPATKPARGAKRKLSAEGRKRIVQATRKRWAAYRAQAAGAAKKALVKKRVLKAAPKRKLSAEQKAALVERLKKARAAKAAKKTAGE